MGEFSGESTTPSSGLKNSRRIPHLDHVFVRIILVCRKLFYPFIVILEFGGNHQSCAFLQAYDSHHAPAQLPDIPCPAPPLSFRHCSEANLREVYLKPSSGYTSH